MQRAGIVEKFSHLMQRETDDGNYKSSKGNSTKFICPCRVSACRSGNMKCAKKDPSLVSSMVAENRLQESHKIGESVAELFDLRKHLQSSINERESSAEVKERLDLFLILWVRARSTELHPKNSLQTRLLCHWIAGQMGTRNTYTCNCPCYRNFRR